MMDGCEDNCAYYYYYYYHDWCVMDQIDVRAVCVRQGTRDSSGLPVIHKIRNSDTYVRACSYQPWFISFSKSSKQKNGTGYIYIYIRIINR